MNSIIQCVNANRDLVEYFLTSYQKNKSDKLEVKLVDEWIILSKALYDKNAVVTKSFHRYIQFVLLKDNNYFTGFNQNDSQRILQFFLENRTMVAREVNMKVNGNLKTI